jgi:hypothetical protein
MEYTTQRNQWEYRWERCSLWSAPTLTHVTIKELWKGIFSVVSVQRLNHEDQWDKPVSREMTAEVGGR